MLNIIVSEIILILVIMIEQADNQGKKVQERKETTEQKQEKKEFHFILFWLFQIEAFFLGWMMFLEDIAAGANREAFIFTILSTSFVLFIVISCLMSKNKMQILHLYFLLDDICLIYFFTIVGIVGLILAISKQFIDLGIESILQILYVEQALYGIDFFLFCGVYRILFKNAKWKKWQIIISKLCLIVDSLGFMIISAQIMLAGNVNETLKDFIFLFTFSFVTLFMEIYTKFTQKDGTGQFQHHYMIVKESQSGNEAQSKKQEEQLNQSNLSFENKQKNSVYPQTFGSM